MDTINKVVILRNTNARIAASDVKKLLEKHDSDLPYECFLNDLETKCNELQSKTNKCSQKKCKTVNEFDAKFCKECGQRLDRTSGEVLINSLDWVDEESANSWNIFVNDVVPKIRGRLLVAVEYGDCYKEDPWKQFFFVIDDGVLSYCNVDAFAVGDVTAPVFDKIDDEEDEDEEEEDYEDDMHEGDR